MSWSGFVSSATRVNSAVARCVGVALDQDVFTERFEASDFGGDEVHARAQDVALGRVDGGGGVAEVGVDAQ